MRCPHCAAAIPDGAAFCGVCGRSVTPPVRATAEPPAEESGGASMSLFELPVSTSARAARVAVVLLLDTILAGAGVAMGWSWWSSRSALAAPAATAVAPGSPDQATGVEPPAPPRPTPEARAPEVTAEQPLVLGRKG